jgi:hypothetical protein
MMANKDSRNQSKENLNLGISLLQNELSWQNIHIFINHVRFVAQAQDISKVMAETPTNKNQQNQKRTSLQKPIAHPCNHFQKIKRSPNANLALEIVLPVSRQRFRSKQYQSTVLLCSVLCMPQKRKRAPSKYAL